MKVRGLEFKARYEDVNNFFRDYDYIEKSVVFGENKEGRKSGFGAILFESEKDAKVAINELNGEYIGSRYVELTLITYGDYIRFNKP